MQKSWTEEEVVLLYDLAKSHTISEIAKKLHRSNLSIKKKLYNLNIKPVPAKGFWSEEDIQTLKDLATKEPIEYISQVLNKSEAAITTKASRLGLSLDIDEIWPSKQVENLIKQAEYTTVTDLAILFSKTESSIRHKLARLNIPIYTELNTWTEKEVELLKNLCNKHKSVKQISRILKRTTASITHKCNRLGLTNTNKIQAYLEEEAKEISILPIISETKRAYLAGHFDGEGCVSLYFTRGTQVRCSIQVKVGWQATLFDYKKYFGGTVAHYADNSKVDFTRHKKMYHWSISTPLKILKFITAVLPYSQEKKEQLMLLKEYLELLITDSVVPFDIASNYYKEIKRLKKWQPDLQ